MKGAKLDLSVHTMMITKSMMNNNIKKLIIKTLFICVLHTNGACFVMGTVVSAKDATVNKRHILCPQEFTLFSESLFI